MNTRSCAAGSLTNGISRRQQATAKHFFALVQPLVFVVVRARREKAVYSSPPARVRMAPSSARYVEEGVYRVDMALVTMRLRASSFFLKSSAPESSISSCAMASLNALSIFSFWPRFMRMLVPGSLMISSTRLM